MTVPVPARTWRKHVPAWIALLGAVGLVSALHYVTPPEHFVLHAIYHRSYYVPIILAAYWYGVAGGVLTAVISAIAYIQHIQTAWFLNRPYTISQYAEAVVFVLVGVAVGIIASHQRRLANRYREAAESLERANRDLRESGERLRRAERLSAVGEIAAGLAHEIRNPLAGVKGALEIVGSRAAASTPEAEFCGIAGRELGRLESLVQEFLDYAKPRPPCRRPADAAMLVRRVQALLQPQADQAGVVLAVEPGSVPGALTIDAEQIEQVLMNVLLNAIEASPRGGRVSITNQAVDGGHRIAISDQGPGVPPDVRPRIFEPFFTTKQRGTGLGLAISQRIVAAHDGEIRITPGQGGRGTTVEILL